jgi:hypothetical protein
MLLESARPRLTLRPLAVAVALATVGLIAPPGSSSAALLTAGAGEATGGQEVFQGLRYGNTEEVALPASNGYRVTVVAKTGTSTPTSTGEVQLITEHGDERTEYLSRGKVTPTSIDASFGLLGDVSLRFRPSGGVLRVRAGHGCVVGVQAELGTFTGTARFSDEATEVVPAGSAVPGGQLGRVLKPPCQAMAKASLAGNGSV